MTPKQIQQLTERNKRIEELEEEVEKYKFLYSQQKDKVSYLRGIINQK